jgi:nucleoid DNA-binding protein
MNKPEIARQLAREGGVSSAEAADHFDRLACDVLTTLKRGEALTLPGMGAFSHASGGRIRFEHEVRTRVGQVGKARG